MASRGDEPGDAVPWPVVHQFLLRFRAGARLVVRRDADGGPFGRWHAEGIAEADTESFPLALPLGDEDTDELRWYLETYAQYAGTGDRARARG